MQTDRPYIWIVDSARTPLASCLAAFSGWAEVRYFDTAPEGGEWEHDRPDAVFFSAEMDGGAFPGLFGYSDSVPFLAVAAMRSLAQAVAWFRAGAMDYLSVPLEPVETEERYTEAVKKLERLTLSPVVVELEAVDGELDDVSLAIAPSGMADIGAKDDVLAEIPTPMIANAPIVPEVFDLLDALEEERENGEPEEGEEPESVNALPIPTLWEELPCGLLVFDSDGNLAFSNQLGLDMFAAGALGELQEALENDRSRYHAFGANHKPLPDNQWPHELARKTRTARSAVVSLEVSEKRRLWLRIDCLPHIVDGAVNRLTMSVINLTGELPPLSLAETVVQPVKRDKGKKRGKRSRRTGR